MANFVKSSVQISAEHLKALAELYPDLSQSEAIRMAVERAVIDPARPKIQPREWVPVERKKE